MVCQEINRVNSLSIQPTVSKLCRVASRMKMSFRDTWSLSVWDDRVIVGHGKSMIKRLKKDLVSQFSMKYLGPTQKILGINYISPKKDRRNVTWKDIIQVVPEDLRWVYLAMVYDKNYIY